MRYPLVSPKCNIYYVNSTSTTLQLVCFSHEFVPVLSVLFRISSSRAVFWSETTITYGGDTHPPPRPARGRPRSQRDPSRLRKFHIGILLTAGVPTEADLVGPDPTRRHVRDLLQDLRCLECVSLPFIIFTVMQSCIHDRL